MNRGLPGGSLYDSVRLRLCRLLTEPRRRARLEQLVAPNPTCLAMPHHLPALILSIVSVAGFIGCQDPADPIAKNVVIRVVGAKDGLPRPGVVVYLRASDAARIDNDGFLVAEDREVRRLRHAHAVRTDPDGRATFVAPTPLQWWQFHIAEPHVRSEAAVQVGDEWVIKVLENEPVGVRVVNANGKVMVGFPVALHAAGKDMVVAITDKTGRAMLGITADFKARAVICPAGWVGPRDAFPTVAESLAGRRGVTMTVPPHGALRLRRLRGGVRQAGAVSAQQFQHPTAYAHLNAPVHATAKNAAGVLYPYVALGIEMTSYSQFGGSERLAFAGPTTAGEVRDVDIDLGPVMTMRCRGFDGDNVRSSVRVRLTTDAGEEESFASRKGQGAFVIDLGRAITGTRLLRIDVDCANYSASQACDHSLRTVAIDLGEFALTAHEPQLSGRVLDTSGKPVANVRVVISATDKPNRGYVKVTDANGRFVSSGPLLRDAKGVPLQLFARARHGQLASEWGRGVAGDVTLTIKPRAPSAHKPVATNGSVVVRLTSKHDPRNAHRVLQLQGRFGVGRLPRAKALPDGGTEITFSKLRAGTYELLAAAPDHGKFVVLDQLVVPGDGPCLDPRLDGLDYMKHMRKVVVHVVDEQSVPIAGATVMLPGSVRSTDGAGNATLYLARTIKTVGTVEMPGKRTVRCDNWPDGLVVTLEQAKRVQIEVVGLPADVPRTHLEVWLRDEVRERFAGPRQLLPANDTVSLPMPARGKYRMYLLVTIPQRNGSRSSTAHVSEHVVEIAENKDLKLKFELQAPQVARLRELIK